MVHVRVYIQGMSPESRLNLHDPYRSVFENEHKVMQRNVERNRWL